MDVGVYASPYNLGGGAADEKAFAPMSTPLAAASASASGRSPVNTPGSRSIDARPMRRAAAFTAHVNTFPPGFALALARSRSLSAASAAAASSGPFSRRLECVLSRSRKVSTHAKARSRTSFSGSTPSGETAGSTRLAISPGS